METDLVFRGQVGLQGMYVDLGDGGGRQGKPDKKLGEQFACDLSGGLITITAR